MEWMLILVAIVTNGVSIAPVPVQYPTESACNAARDRFSERSFSLSKCIPVPKK